MRLDAKDQAMEAECVVAQHVDVRQRCPATTIDQDEGCVPTRMDVFHVSARVRVSLPSSPRHLRCGSKYRRTFLRLPTASFCSSSSACRSLSCARTPTLAHLPFLPSRPVRRTLAALASRPAMDRQAMDAVERVIVVGMANMEHVLIDSEDGRFFPPGRKERTVPRNSL